MSDIDMWHHILLSTSLKVKKGSQGKECWIVCFRGNSSHVWTRVSAAKFPREDDVKARLHSSCCSTAPELLPIEWKSSPTSSLDILLTRPNRTLYQTNNPYNLQIRSKLAFILPLCMLCCMLWVVPSTNSAQPNLRSNKQPPTLYNSDWNLLLFCHCACHAAWFE